VYKNRERKREWDGVEGIWPLFDFGGLLAEVMANVIAESLNLSKGTVKSCWDLILKE